jgi:hypothetical protein
MLIDGADPFAATKPDARLIKLLIRARRFDTALIHSDGLPFAALAQQEGVSRSYLRGSSASAISLQTSPKRSSTGASRDLTPRTCSTTHVYRRPGTISWRPPKTS